jgi:predicted DNA-binding transcriptional regulator AlpA
MSIRCMSRQEIADYLGVSLATVKGYVDFPPPDVQIGRNKGWTRETVDEWYDRQVRRGRDKKAKPQGEQARDFTPRDDLPERR